MISFVGVAVGVDDWIAREIVPLAKPDDLGGGRTFAPAVSARQPPGALFELGADRVNAVSVAAVEVEEREVHRAIRRCMA